MPLRFWIGHQLKSCTDVVLIAATILDTGSYFKCVPYRRIRHESKISSFKIEFHSWPNFLFFTGLGWLHVCAQWIAFTSYVSHNGVNARSCLHLNFLVIYSLSVLFSLQITCSPQSMLVVQNEIEPMEKQFETFWTHHPVILLIIPLLPMMLVTIPMIAAALYVIDPTCPMFVTSAVLTKMKAPVTVFEITLYALVEGFIIFYAALIVFSASQTCAITVVALSTWLLDLR